MRLGEHWVMRMSKPIVLLLSGLAAWTSKAPAAAMKQPSSVGLLPLTVGWNGQKCSISSEDRTFIYPTSRVRYAIISRAYHPTRTLSACQVTFDINALLRWCQQRNTPASSGSASYPSQHHPVLVDTRAVDYGRFCLIDARSCLSAFHQKRDHHCPTTTLAASTGAAL